MKCRYFYILFFALIFNSYFIQNSFAMDHDEERRLINHSSPEAFLASFGEMGINHGKHKILFIGAGLTYDDLVEKSHSKFSKEDISEKTRRKYFPSNAFLIDFDGKFFYQKSLSSKSDFQADIGKGIALPNGLPKEFVDQFDFIVLENLDYEAMTTKAFQNLYSLLKVGGKIICNVDYEVQIADLRKIKETRQGRLEFAVLDEYDHALVELYYPHTWVEEHESLLAQYTYIICPIVSKDDESFKQLAIHHKDKELKLIPFREFEKLYHENLAYKKYILNEGKGVFRHNLTQYIKAILPSASLSFVDEEILWCGALPVLGFFIIAKDK